MNLSQVIRNMWRGEITPLEKAFEEFEGVKDKDRFRGTWDELILLSARKLLEEGSYGVADRESRDLFNQFKTRIKKMPNDRKDEHESVPARGGDSPK